MSKFTEHTREGTRAWNWEKIMLHEDLLTYNLNLFA